MSNTNEKEKALGEIQAIDMRLASIDAELELLEKAKQELDKK